MIQCVKVFIIVRYLTSSLSSAERAAGTKLLFIVTISAQTGDQLHKPDVSLIIIARNERGNGIRRASVVCRDFRTSNEDIISKRCSIK
jgi:hypothetical protein